MAFYFPPARASGVFRARAIANHFVSAGWSVSVLTADESFFTDTLRQADHTMASTVDENQLINAAVVLGTTRDNSTITFSNQSTTNSLTLAGNVSGAPSGGTAGTKTLNLNGAGEITGRSLVDEYGVLFRNLFAMDNVDAGAIHGIIISSVVPPLDSTLRYTCAMNRAGVPDSLTGLDLVLDLGKPLAGDLVPQLGEGPHRRQLAHAQRLKRRVPDPQLVVVRLRGGAAEHGGRHEQAVVAAEGAPVPGDRRRHAEARVRVEVVRAEEALGELGGEVVGAALVGVHLHHQAAVRVLDLGFARAEECRRRGVCLRHAVGDDREALHRVTRMINLKPNSSRQTDQFKSAFVVSRRLPIDERRPDDGIGHCHASIRGLREDRPRLIGDGANDLRMMREAGISIAFRAKAVVRAQATCALNWSGLDGVLNLFE